MPLTASTNRVRTTETADRSNCMKQPTEEGWHTERQTGHRADLQGRQVRQDSQDASDEDRAQRHLRCGRFLPAPLPTPSGTAISSPVRWSHCRMARSSKRCGSAKSSAEKRTNGGSVRTLPIRIFPPTEPGARAAKFRCSFSKPCKAQSRTPRGLIPSRTPWLIVVSSLPTS